MTSCHASVPSAQLSGGVALVGHPNVGKSVIFQHLTGHYDTVSNYPRTTVELARGTAPALDAAAIIDTPGVVMLSLCTEDEQVTAKVLIHERLLAVVQVGDAKNLRGTLLLTVHLADLGVPLVLALNIIDEAGAHSISNDYTLIGNQLGIPIVLTIFLVSASVGWLAADLIPGERSLLLLELPPLRLPVLTNIVTKTLARGEWYVKEVVPMCV